MTLKTTGGAELKAQVDHPRGSIENPMSPEDMSNKAHMLGDGVIGRNRMDAVIEQARNIEKLSSISDLIQLTVPTSPVRATIGARRA